jgi:stress response protein YsnF
MKERVNVDRIEINRFVDGPVPVRYEGDVMIVPVLEEVLVIEKRLMLKEELRVSKYAHEVHEPQEVTVRVEEARVEHVPVEKV